MIILVDTLEKKNKHITDAFEAACISWRPLRLKQGDYMKNGVDATTIDRKSGLQEVYGNLIGKEHARFKRECDRAMEAGQRLIVLVETHYEERHKWCVCKEPEIKTLEDVHKWRNPREKLFYSSPQLIINGRKPRPPVSAKQLQKIMETMAAEHGVEWMFVRSEDCGKKIIEILKKSIDK